MGIKLGPCKVISQGELASGIVKKINYGGPNESEPVSAIVSGLTHPDGTPFKWGRSESDTYPVDKIIQ